MVRILRPVVCIKASFEKKKDLFASRFELETSCVLDRCDDQLHHANRYESMCVPVNTMLIDA